MTCLGCQFPSIAAFPVYVDVSVCRAARQTAVSCLTSTLGWLSESLFIPGVNIHLSSAARLDGRLYDVWWKMCQLAMMFTLKLQSMLQIMLQTGASSFLDYNESNFVLTHHVCSVCMWCRDSIMVGCLWLASNVAADQLICYLWSWIWLSQ